MTTAHRPTWDPAMATNSSRGAAPSQQFCARDQPAQLNMKLRQEGQDTSEEVRMRDLKDELEERERVHYSKRKRGGEEERRLESKRIKYETSGVPSVTTKIKESYRSVDADDEDDSESDNDSDSDDSDSDEESDDEEELMKELEKIRKERMQEQQRQEEKKHKEQEEKHNAALMTSNPLIAMGEGGGDYSVKKKWWEDTVFRNQAKETPLADESFINDSLRNNFHRKFMDKYIK